MQRRDRIVAATLDRVCHGQQGTVGRNIERRFSILGQARCQLGSRLYEDTWSACLAPPRLRLHCHPWRIDSGLPVGMVDVTLNARIDTCSKTRGSRSPQLFFPPNIFIGLGIMPMGFEPPESRPL
jgi:hypothetical protein